MKNKYLLIAIFMFVCSLSYSQNDIDRYKVIINQYPTNTPNGGVPDAPVTGNGDIGITMRASKESVRYYIGKNDFWRFVAAYPSGSVVLPGGFDIESEQISKGKYYAEERPGSAEIFSSFDAGELGRLDVNSWVAATDNKIVIELETTVKTQIKINLWAQIGGMGVVSEGADSKCSWVTRSIDNNPCLERDSYIAMSVNRPEKYISLQPGKKEIIVITVYTNFDADNWKEKAISEAGGFSSIEKLKTDHRKWWNDFWELSHISISDFSLEQHYYMSQYFFACASRKGKFAPGLYGPFITTDSPNWAGDYHLNYNYQAPYWDTYSSNHLLLSDNYDVPILAAMEKCREYARKMHGIRGVNYPVGLGPMGLISSSWGDGKDHSNECGAMFWHQKSNASFAAANMLMRFYSTYDLEYARMVYPFIKECANFWEDYLVLENGKYQVKHDIFYETDPFTVCSDSNSTTTLGFVKMTMKGAADISGFLGVDKDRIKKWNDIYTRLYPYPLGRKADGKLTVKNIESRNAGIIQLGSDSELNYRIIMHGTILPAGVTGPIIDPDFNNVMLDDIAGWEAMMHEGRDWACSFGNGFETCFAGAVRAGYPAADVIKFLKDRIKRKIYPNSFIYQSGGGVETLSCVPLTVNEMLMQSFEHVIRIFPNWDRSKDASFENLRAYGAFLVSSSISNGKIGPVRILSEKGRVCKMENPWPGRKIQIKADGSKPEIASGNFIEFRTKENQKIEIFPVQQ